MEACDTIKRTIEPYVRLHLHGEPATLKELLDLLKVTYMARTPIQDMIDKIKSTSQSHTRRLEKLEIEALSSMAQKRGRDIDMRCILMAFKDRREASSMVTELRHQQFARTTRGSEVSRRYAKT